MIETREIIIGWLYPTLMNLYGDRGNIIALEYRCKKRNIKVKVIKIGIGDNIDWTKIDLIFFGGGQDRQQLLVAEDLVKKKPALVKYYKNNKPLLAVCGGYQLLGKYFKTNHGKKINGLGILNLYTIAGKKRMIGDVIMQVDFLGNKEIVGFENHSGNTFLDDRGKCFGSVFQGYGNNDIDKTEGIKQRNFIGTYLHGPILPKNPELTDWLIEKALEIKYNKKFRLAKISDEFEQKAKQLILRRY